MKRSRNPAGPLAALCLMLAAPAVAGQPPAPAGDVAGRWEAMATDDLDELAGGSRGFDLGMVVDDVQLNASNTTTTVSGNTISGFNSGAAMANAMSDIHGFGNTMVVSTGVLTLSNSVNVNVSVDMSR